MLQQHRKIISSILHVVIGSGAARAITLLNSLIIARRLGVADFGKFSLFYMVSVLAWQMPLGFDTAYLRFAKDRDQIAKNEYLVATIAWKALYGAVIAFAASAYMLAHVSAWGTEWYGGLIASGVLAGAFLSFSGSVSAVYQETGRFGLFSLVNNLTSVAYTVALMALLAIPGAFTIRNVLYAYTATSLLLGVGSAQFVLSRVGWLKGFRTDRFREVFAFGKWVFGVTVAYFLFQRVDVLIVGRVLAYSDLGVYGAAVQLAMVVSLFTGSVGAVLMPRAMRAGESRQAFVEYVRSAILPGVAMVLGIAVLSAAATPVVSLLYGEKFLGAVPAVRILLIGWLFSASYLPFSYVYYGLNLPHLRFMLESSKLGIALAALLVLVPKMGVIGAAWAVAIALASEVIVSGGVLAARLRDRFKSNANTAGVIGVSPRGEQC